MHDNSKPSIQVPQLRLGGEEYGQGDSTCEPLHRGFLEAVQCMARVHRRHGADAHEGHVGFTVLLMEAQSALRNGMPCNLAVHNLARRKPSIILSGGKSLIERCHVVGGLRLDGRVRGEARHSVDTLDMGMGNGAMGMACLWALWAHREGAEAR